MKAKRWLGYAACTLVVLGILPFTPLFSQLGVGALSLFSAVTLDSPTVKPQSIILLGGGLHKTKQGEIILSPYSQTRVAHTVQFYHTHPLPIVTSGAESPWLREFLTKELDSPFILSDNASLNTCENAVFTAKLLGHHELPMTAHLITDRYHMARARRQFAKAGITTVAEAAPLPTELAWLKPKNNLKHSRRTAYEIVALARDIFRPQNNCRTSDRISIEEISTPRRKAKIFSLLTHPDDS